MNSPPVSILIDNRVRVSGLDNYGPEIIARFKELFTHSNPEYAMAISMRRSSAGIERTISTWTMQCIDGGLVYSFPRGGMSRVRAALRDANIAYTATDARQPGEHVTHSKPRRPLFPHQLDIVDAIHTRQNVIIKSGTSSGKTSAVLGSFHLVAAPCLVVVNTTALADQWVERCEIDLGLKNHEVGRIMGGKTALRPVTVAINKTLHKALQDPTLGPSIKAYFGGVFADEIQGAPARTTYECIDGMPAKYRIGVSADHRRKDRKEFYTTDIFGEVAFELNHAELIEAGRVMDVECRLIRSDYECEWYGLDPRRTFVHLVQEMAENTARENVWLPYLEKEARAGRTIMVFAHERAHCESIVQRIEKMGFRAGLMLGGPESKQEFDATLAGLRTGSMKIGVGTIQAVGTGLDIPSAEVGFVVTPVASNRQNFGQIRGRLCRMHPGKTVSRLYMVMDPKVYGDKHEQNIKSWNPSTVICTN